MVKLCNEDGGYEVRVEVKRGWWRYVRKIRVMEKGWR